MVYRAQPRLWNMLISDYNRPVSPTPLQPNPRQWPDKGLHAAWLGHSTVLLKIDGFTILTDPVFSERIGLNFGPLTIGMKRLVDPAIRLTNLIKPDLILLSHAHMDHWDIPSLRGLEDKKTAVVNAWETSDLLRPNRYQSVHELRWETETRIGPATIRAFEVNHWGARMRRDTYRGYNGYQIDLGQHRVIFAGDTADTDLLKHLKTSKGIDLAIMPIGAYNPWLHAHCTPEQAWRMANEAGAEFLIPAHHQTFTLSDEPTDEPIYRFQAAASHPDRVALHTIGQEFHLS